MIKSKFSSSLPRRSFFSLPHIVPLPEARDRHHRLVSASSKIAFYFPISQKPQSKSLNYKINSNSLSSSSHLHFSGENCRCHHCHHHDSAVNDRPQPRHLDFEYYKARPRPYPLISQRVSLSGRLESLSLSTSAPVNTSSLPPSTSSAPTTATLTAAIGSALSPSLSISVSLSTPKASPPDYSSPPPATLHHHHLPLSKISGKAYSLFYEKIILSSSSFFPFSFFFCVR